MENTDAEKKAEEEEDDETLPGSKKPLFSPTDIITGPFPEEGGAKVPIKPPGAGALKDLRKGPMNVVKGIAVDSAKQILGGQSLSATEDAKAAPIVNVDDAANAIVMELAKPKMSLGNFDLLPVEKQKQILRALKNDPALRGVIATTTEGTAFLAKHKIEVGVAGKLVSASVAVKKGATPTKTGGAAGIVTPVVSAPGAVLAGLLATEKFFAANPPDP